jgi:succinate dehydrogenase/fumarate reductase flavoprotein subunit
MDFLIQNLGQVVASVVALAGLVTSGFYAKKARRAELRAKEIENQEGYINNADLMVELVKKANAEAAEIQTKLIKELKTENEKFKKTASKLEQALKKITVCMYRDQCPVYDELQKQGSDQAGRTNGDRGNPGRDPGYGPSGRKG